MSSQVDFKGTRAGKRLSNDGRPGIWVPKRHSGRLEGICAFGSWGSSLCWRLCAYENKTDHDIRLPTPAPDRADSPHEGDEERMRNSHGAGGTGHGLVHLPSSADSDIHGFICLQFFYRPADKNASHLWNGLLCGLHLHATQQTHAGLGHSRARQEAHFPGQVFRRHQRGATGLACIPILLTTHRPPPLKMRKRNPLEVTSPFRTKIFPPIQYD